MQVDTRLTQPPGFQPRLLLSAVTSGVISSVILIIVAISFATLIFSGPLQSYVPRAIGFILFGTVVISGITALTSSFPSMVSCPQDNPAAILAAIAGVITAGAVGSRDQAAATLIATIIVSSLLTGITCMLLARFHLGNLVRYIPYPVIGGFLAGVGYLLVQGSFSVLADEPFDLLRLSHFFEPELLIRWLPGVIFAVSLLLIVRRLNHFLVIPSMIVAAIILFYVVLALTHTPIEQALQQKLLLGGFPSGGLWQPPDSALLAQVNWSTVAAQIPSIFTVVVISIFSLLLNLSGLEVVARNDFDLNRELNICGITNIVAGFGGSAPGYPALSLSALGYKTAPGSRLVGLTVAILSALTLVFGASVVTYLPKYVLGGLLLFLGLSFLAEWLYDTWFHFRRMDYFIVLGIMLVMAAVGVLESVAVGMIFAVISFVVDYSQVDVVKHGFSGKYFRSNVERSLFQGQLLAERGSWIHILELQGFIFFGDSNRLLNTVHQRLENTEPLHYLILDFRQVTGIDVSAAVSFVKLKQLAQRKQFTLIFTDLLSPIQRRLEKEVLTAQDSDVWRVFPTLDYGLEWCEEQILKTVEQVDVLPKRKTAPLWIGEYFSPLENVKGFWASMLLDELSASNPDAIDALLTRLSTYFERKEFAKDAILVQQGQIGQGLYFIEAGQVAVIHETADKKTRLRVLGPGTAFGEIGLYTGSTATASVVSTQPTIVQLMTAANLNKMEAQDPNAAMVLHKFLVHMLSDRLVRSTAVIENLSQ